MRSIDRLIRDPPAATSGPADRRAADSGGYPKGWEGRESADAKRRAACSLGLQFAARPAIAPNSSDAPNRPPPPDTADPSRSQPQETGAAMLDRRSSTIVIESPGRSRAKAPLPPARSARLEDQMARSSLAVASAHASGSSCRCHEDQSPKRADAPPTVGREIPMSVAGSTSTGSPPVQ